MKLGDGWSYLAATNRIRHVHLESSWTALLESFPYRCRKCGAILPERFEFPVRIAQGDYDQRQALLLAKVEKANHQMAALWNEARIRLFQQIFLDGDVRGEIDLKDEK